MATSNQHQYIKKLRGIRDNLYTVLEIMREAPNGHSTESDYAIALSMLEELYVDTDLAIDHPCGCKDDH